MPGMIGRCWRRTEHRSDCSTGSVPSVADCHFGSMRSLDRRLPALCCPHARQHRLFRAKVFAVAPHLRLTAGAMLPVMERSALAAEASHAPPQPRALSPARLPPAVQAATAVVGIVVLPAPVAQAVGRARPLSRRQIAVGTCSSPTRSGSVSEPYRAMRSVLARFQVPPVATPPASSDIPDLAPDWDLRSSEAVERSPEWPAWVAAPARLANALRARQC